MRRTDGTGCVYARKRKDGTTRGWWIKFYVNGDQRIVNAHTTDKGEALDKLAQLLGKKAEGAPIPRRQMTLGQAVANVRADNAAHKRAPRRKNDAYDLHLLPFFGARTQMSAIKTPRIREYIVARQRQSASNATINRELSALSRAFTLAMKDGLLFAKPYIRKLTEDNVRTGFFEREEFERVLAALADAPHVRDVVEFLYITGWRVYAEVLPLRWSQVDFEAGTVRLEPGTTKNKKGRTFPMTPALRRLLERRRAAQKEHRKPSRRSPLADLGLVFTRSNGRPIVGFVKRWRAACAAAGVPGRLLHDFRRTAVRNLVRAGISERVAMQMSGHKTRSVFDRYDIVSEGDLHEAARRLAEREAAAGTAA